MFLACGFNHTLSGFSLVVPGVLVGPWADKVCPLPSPPAAAATAAAAAAAAAAQEIQMKHERWWDRERRWRRGPGSAWWLLEQQIGLCDGHGYERVHQEASHEMQNLSKCGVKLDAQGKLTLLEQAAAPVCLLPTALSVGKSVMLEIYVSVVRLFVRLYPLLIPNPRLVQNHAFSRPAAASTSERH